MIHKHDSSGSFRVVNGWPNGRNGMLGPCHGWEKGGKLSKEQLFVQARPDSEYLISLAMEWDPGLAGRQRSDTTKTRLAPDPASMISYYKCWCFTSNNQQHFRLPDCSYFICISAVNQYLLSVILGNPRQIYLTLLTLSEERGQALVCRFFCDQRAGVFIRARFTQSGVSTQR